MTDAIQLSIEIPKKIKCQFFPDMKIHAGIESVKKNKKEELSNIWEMWQKYVVIDFFDAPIRHVYKTNAHIAFSDF